jgi:spermidine/putrescine transport system substrate-binding protein
MRNLLFCLLLCLSYSSLGAQETLVIFNWTEYLPQPVLERFTRETGIKVRYSTYDSNEAMYAKVKTVEGKGYDLLVPSTYFLDRMRREGLLQKIDRSKLNNFANLDPKLLNQPHDPNNDYSIPYLWGTTGIGIASDAIAAGSIGRWADLWDPAYKDKLLLLNDVREVFGMALKTLGYSINSTSETEIRAAYEKLGALMPNVRVFNSDSPKDLFLAGEVKVGMIYSGEAYMARKEDPDIRYIYPQEGVAVWLDSLVISKGAKNLQAAYRFIDFVLRPEIGRIITEEIGYASPNLATVRLLPENVRNDRTIYPTAEDLQNAEFQTDVGAALSIYEQYWQQLKTGR